MKTMKDSLNELVSAGKIDEAEMHRILATSSEMDAKPASSQPTNHNSF
jgi:hypothetical protein